MWVHLEDLQESVRLLAMFRHRLHLASPTDPFRHYYARMVRELEEEIRGRKEAIFP